MELKYIGTDGLEHVLQSTAELVEAVKSGALTGQTLVYDATASKWVRGAEQRDCAALMSLASVSHPLETIGDLRPPPTTLDPDTQRKTRNARYVFLTGWVVLIVGPIVAGMGAERLGYVIGESLPLALIVAAIGYWWARGASPEKKASRKLGTSIAFALLCAFFVGKELITSLQERADAGAIVARMDKMVEIQKRVATGEAAARAPSTSLPEFSPEQSVLQKLGTLLDRAQQRSTATLASYQQALRDAQFDQVLTPATLTSARQRTIARAHVNAARAAISKYEADYRANEESARTDIQQGGFPAETMTGFEKGAKERAVLFGEFLQIERDIAAAADEVLTLADMSHPTLSQDGKRLVFPTQNYLDRYSELVEQVRALGKRETAVGQKEAERMQRVRDDVKASL